MLKHPRRPRDPFALAVQLGEESTGQRPKQVMPEPSEMAVRGAKGGRKGGKARARTLSPRKRRAIAKAAARARWGR